MRLEPPLRRYLTGARPSHSSTVSLASNFENLPRETLMTILVNHHYVEESTRRPTRKALDDDVLDQCEGKGIWNLLRIEELLKESWTTPTRAVVNQEITDDGDGEPRWVNLGTLSTYFSTTAVRVGGWLDDLGLRDTTTKLGNQEAADQGLSTVVEMNAGGKKTRKVAMWNLYPTLHVLKDAGHILDFDYEKILKGSGKNSDVKVTSTRDRAVEVAHEFVRLFKDPERRRETVKLIEKQPKAVQQEVEKVLRREPGFITAGIFKKYVR